jgi:hypothetical protein
MAPEGSDTLEPVVRIPRTAIGADSRVWLLGARGSAPLESRQNGDGIEVNVPERIRGLLPCRYAFVFRIAAPERRGVRVG